MDDPFASPKVLARFNSRASRATRDDADVLAAFSFAPSAAAQGPDVDSGAAAYGDEDARLPVEDRLLAHDRRYADWANYSKRAGFLWPKTLF